MMPAAQFKPVHGRSRIIQHRHIGRSLYAAFQPEIHQHCFFRIFTTQHRPLACHTDPTGVSVPLVDHDDPVSVIPDKLAERMAHVRISIFLRHVYRLHRFGIDPDRRIGLMPVRPLARRMHDQVIPCHRHIAVSAMECCLHITLFLCDRCRPQQIPVRIVFHHIERDLPVISRRHIITAVWGVVNRPSPRLSRYGQLFHVLSPPITGNPVDHDRLGVILRCGGI